MTSIAKIWRSISDAIFPRQCPVCQSALSTDEVHLCRNCFMRLPRTMLHTIPFNRAEQLFAGKVPIVHAAGYFYYQKDSPYANILHDIKYRNLPQMAHWLAARYVEEIRQSGHDILQGIEAVVPVPLHPTKLAQRGYNQSRYIAEGIAEMLGIPVVDALQVTRQNETQTRKGIYERWLNTQNLYEASPQAASLQGKHILLVDDVITTGATLLACAIALKESCDVSISLLSLAVARSD